MTPIERRRLQSIHESMAELVLRNDGSAFAAANLTFLPDLCGRAQRNHYRVVGGLRRRLGPFRKAQFRTEGRLPRSQEEHGNVVKAKLRHSRPNIANQPLATPARYRFIGI
jgi:hypothetical protein